MGRVWASVSGSGLARQPLSCCNPAVKRSEWEQRKRLLEEQFRTGIGLLQAGHAARLRELEEEWLAAPEEDEPALEPRRVRASPGQLYEEVTAVLFSVPEVFDRNHVVRALGYRPDRVSLFRVLRTLEEEGKISVESSGKGRKGTVYRRKDSGDAAESGGNIMEATGNIPERS